jgi:hypothetical protein
MQRSPERLLTRSPKKSKPSSNSNDFAQSRNQGLIGSPWPRIEPRARTPRPQLAPPTVRPQHVGNGGDGGGGDEGGDEGGRGRRRGRAHDEGPASGEGRRGLKRAIAPGRRAGRGREGVEEPVGAEAKRGARRRGGRGRGRGTNLTGVMALATPAWSMEQRQKPLLQCTAACRSGLVED